MRDELLDVVLARADDSALPDEVTLLLLAALTGEAELRSALDPDVGAVAPTGDAPLPEPTRSRTYLSSVTVEGFRGIGAKSRLALTPGPGLSVVCGRNGSGKSSFAEALEVALSRQSYRWESRTSLLMKTWQNLHQADGTSIKVEVAVEDHGTTTIGADWAAGAELSDVKSWTQQPGLPREPGLTALGWTGLLTLHRPFLSYEELDALLARGSKLHQALNEILGIERLDHARNRLKQALATYSKDQEAADEVRGELRPMLEASPDERAPVVSAMLRKRPPNPADIAKLIIEPAPDDGRARIIAAVAGLTAPAVEPYRSALDTVRRAIVKLTSLDQTEQSATARRLTLLQLAVDHHDADGDGTCPVCAQGTLDGSWAELAKSELATQQVNTQALAVARREVEDARHALGRLVSPAPHNLASAAELGMEGAGDARQAWSAWADLSVEESLERGTEALDDVVRTLPLAIDAARREAELRQDAWQPIALKLSVWHERAVAAASSTRRCKDLKSADTWLKEESQRIRNERIQPLAERARRIWAQLRQESNVDLGDICFVGTGKRGTVELGASVDGKKAGALEVMSQGELNALALALFIPKASLPESPFGFMVIDDPVQAMDPAKVDGLARVLADVAEHRQVVVFTHDDRLPEAIRRLQLPAHLMQVTRATDSALTISDAEDPAERYLSDAYALTKDPKIPDLVKGRVVAKLCRMGLEARCRDLWFARQLRAGARRHDIERVWTDTEKTSARVALVVGGDAKAQLGDWIDRGVSRRRKLALGVCTSAPHTGLKARPDDAVQAVRWLLEDLQQVKAPRASGAGNGGGRGR